MIFCIVYFCILPITMSNNYYFGNVNNVNFQLPSSEQSESNQIQEVQSHNSTTNTGFNEYNGTRHSQTPVNEVNNDFSMGQMGSNGFPFFSFPVGFGPMRNITTTNAHLRESATLNTNNDVLQLHIKPKYPKYTDLFKRISSFRHWPPEIVQTPEGLAEAGFFYTGTGDKVRCFFCGIGLMGWEPDDDVWEEHERWSPTCIHLTNCKNNAYETGEVAYRPRGAEGYMEADLRTLENISSPLLKTIAAESSIKFSAEDLLKIVFQLEDKTIDYDEIVANQNGNTQKESDTELKTIDDRQHVQDDSVLNVPQIESQRAKSMEEEVRRLRDQTLCIVCHKEKLATVFLPCGHLVCCSKCAPALKKCPKCHDIIKGSVKTSFL
ncbi:hypothetical protein KUTeg_006941 [Tegillarca granosa]|uniref:RING-type domain-containing protein n=1 Tax=Tegillarca granosa TaxID=220873 RepID=A0ABQ9FDS5_TEGGR|nr:hypothetical protein KUTeg_006941 [Tegillarca granosa]